MTTIIKRNKWEIWRDVIFALFAREIRTGFNDKFGLSWAIINPLIFIALLSYLRSLIKTGETHTVPIFIFMACGIFYLQLFLTTLNECAGSINKNKALYAFRQVQPISAVLAAGLFSLLVKIAVFVGVVSAVYFLKIEARLDDPLLLIATFCMIFTISLSLGLSFGLLECFIPEFKKIRSFLTRPMMFVSGVFFSLQDIPKEYWYLVDWNPLLHGIELSRYALFHSYEGVGVSLAYLANVTICSCFFSLMLYTAIWRQAISR
jgi:capsular polysaccharide transport system permease protein